MAKRNLKAIAAKLLATVPMDVSDRKIRKTEMECMPVVLDIGRLFALVRDEKLKRNIMQRNDELRREQGRAKHVTSALHTAHLDVVVAFWENEFHLIDGCHRVGHWFESLGAEIPSHVVVLLKVPRTEEEYLSLYRAYDSNKSTKTKRDYLYGYFRYLKVDDKITCHLLQTGSWVTAFNNLHKGGGEKEEVDTVRAYLPALLKLNDHGLRSEEVPQGFLLAAIRLYHSKEDSAPVKEYVNDLINAYTRGASAASEPTRQVLHAFNAVRQDFGDSIGGENATKQIAEVIELGFDTFTRARTGKNAKEFTKKRVLAPMSKAKLV